MPNIVDQIGYIFAPRVLYSEKILPYKSKYRTNQSIKEQLDFEKQGPYIHEVDLTGTGLDYSFQNIYSFEFTARKSFRLLQKLADINEADIR